MTTTERDALRGMTIPEIRRAQDLVRVQLPIAYAKGLTDALTKLQEWERDYTDEMLRRTA